MRAIREQHGHTQEYLTNNTRLKVWDYENGHKVPSLESVAKFCEFYDIAMSEFFSTIDYPSAKR